MALEGYKSNNNVVYIDVWRIRKMSKTKEEIVSLVREGKTAIAWITSKGALVHIPQHPVGRIAGVDASFFDDPNFPEPVIVVDGVKGLAAVDPEWDGSALFKCETPTCGKTHNVDWMVHENFWKENV